MKAPQVGRALPSKGSCLTHLTWLELPLGNHPREQSLPAWAKKPRRIGQQLPAAVPAPDYQFTWWFLSADLAMKPSGWEFCQLLKARTDRGKESFFTLSPGPFLNVTTRGRSDTHRARTLAACFQVLDSLLYRAFKRPIYTLPSFPQFKRVDNTL